MRDYRGRVLLFVLLALLVAGVWYMRPTEQPGSVQSGNNAQSATVAVELAPVQQDTIRNIRRFTGTLHPAAQFEVAPRVGGKLEELYVDIGDRVEKGQAIARLDDAEYSQEVQEAEAAVAVAQATLAEARSSLDAKEKEYQRTKQLRQEKIASESELDTVQAEAVAQEARVELARAQVSQAEAALRLARVRLSYTRIQADWQNGDQQRVVGERFVDEGTTISANTPIVSVIDISQLIAVVFVTEADYPNIEIGQSVRIVADAYPEREFSGSIVRIAPRFREASRQARVEIRIDNEQRLLKPGMFIGAHVETARESSATIVPMEAVIKRDDRQGVFVINRQTKMARFVPVATGITEGERVEVIRPELSGEVAVLGQHLLEDGSRVVIADDGQASE